MYYKEKDIIVRGEGRLTDSSEFFMCEISNSSKAFFSAMDSRGGGFTAPNAGPIPGFRPVSNAEYEDFMGIEDEPQYDEQPNMPEDLVPRVATIEVRLVEQNIIKEVYLAHLQHCLATEGEKIGTKLDKRSASDRAITKTIAANETLFGYVLPELIERYGE